MGTEITISRLGRHFFCRETTHMPPSGRQLMSIGASEHRAFVRAKARFAGQRAQEHSFVRRNAVFTGHIAMYRWRHFLAESAARALPFPTSQRPTCPLPTRCPSGHLRPALSPKPPPTLAEPRPAVSGRDCRRKESHVPQRKRPTLLDRPQTDARDSYL